MDQLVTYSLQLRGSMRQQLVLPHRYLRGQFLAGDGVIQPAGKVPAFEVVLQRSWIEMPYRGAEITHGACCGDDLAVDWPEVEPPLPGQGDIGVLVAVPHVGSLALCHGERTRRPGAETHTGPP